MKSKNREIRIIWVICVAVFVLFLILPVIRLLIKSLGIDNGITLQYYIDVLSDNTFVRALGNSFIVAGISSLITVIIAFMIAYTVHYTNVPVVMKTLIKGIIILPMLLPTLTYGFALIYSFGKQGLLTRLIGRQIFEIYGFNGLVIGYVVYTLPTAFILINNVMQYIDKKYIIVSKLMGDNFIKTFYITVLRPMAGTLMAAFIQSFFLSFTDFGIPASVGGQYDVVASVLYTQMLGSVPDFYRGSVIAIMMLIPSVISIIVLNKVEKYNIRYNKISKIEIETNLVRDAVAGLISIITVVAIVAVFAVIFIVPFVADWPYNVGFSMKHFSSVISDSVLSAVYKNSLFVALITAVIGTLISYGAALITARSNEGYVCRKIIDSIALITNTIPGMVLGLAFLFSFSGTDMQGTFTIIIICNVIHFFSTPYLMMKSSLEKMNSGWETTALLMGDNWIKTIIRVVTPNAISSLIEVFSYYFINAMVTVSAVVFIAGARTMVITTKIKELQYYNKFNEVFVLSLLILITNIVVKVICGVVVRITRTSKVESRRMSKNTLKRIACAGLSMILAITGLTFAGCKVGNSPDKVVIYSNADDEAVNAMKAALDNNGYEGQYIFQTFGTSELGGKLMAEKNNIEADIVTMSTFYIDSAQDDSKMFKKLEFDVNTIDESPEYCAPITAQAGTIIVNTDLIKKNNLKMPESLKDLADAQYAGQIAVTDIASSSTAWLLIQGLISEYGEDGTKDILRNIYKNAGNHIEKSGSGPIKLVRAGETAIGFGLRQQAIADKENGLPIDYIDPKEGNYTLTESIAVVDKKDKSNPKAMEMAQCIVENARKQILEDYMVPLYEGETVSADKQAGNPRKFSQKLTVDLLKKHQEISNNCK